MAYVQMAAGLLVAQVARTFAIQTSIRTGSIVQLKEFHLFIRDLLLYPVLDSFLFDHQVIVRSDRLVWSWAIWTFCRRMVVRRMVVAGCRNRPTGVVDRPTLRFAFVQSAVGPIDPDLLFRLPVTYLQKLPLQHHFLDALLELAVLGSSAALAQSPG